MDYSHPSLSYSRASPEAWHSRVSTWQAESDRIDALTSSVLLRSASAVRQHRVPVTAANGGLPIINTGARLTAELAAAREEARAAHARADAAEAAAASKIAAAEAAAALKVATAQAAAARAVADARASETSAQSAAARAMTASTAMRKNLVAASERNVAMAERVAAAEGIQAAEPEPASPPALKATTPPPRASVVDILEDRLQSALASVQVWKRTALAHERDATALRARLHEAEAVIHAAAPATADIAIQVTPSASSAEVQASPSYATVAVQASDEPASPPPRWASELDPSALTRRAEDAEMRLEAALLEIINLQRENQSLDDAHATARAQLVELGGFASKLEHWARDLACQPPHQQ
ncbi:uncharacterized protein AMSG_00321 [Thecamonas trahens ATCC 50062]|uniref:Uncharacterized protein n=1 Tax=Thecamonas trahens ATCC 50062 TaxID=461836 RepID=A0A0L0D1R6_THETB|nr:hypothetical protein AMSG_00321 [Thecamonas trahens ATCC 50062]KNC46202.1 hypothetical protein AMSG_00321 [Thecamonas trahens ATCC 50062]|eukprot:XP_013763177.1 hypothetical protein AMSG_00321 [Thecamonas trahens ATCC 50062]